MLCATSVKSFFEDDFGGTFDGGSMVHSESCLMKLL